jgi:hypothetical protein
VALVISLYSIIRAVLHMTIAMKKFTISFVFLKASSKKRKENLGQYCHCYNLGSSQEKF